jgi:hypothetical protein
VGLFEPYAAPVEAVYGAGDAITAHAGDAEHLAGGVDAAHVPAQHGVAGLLAGPMADAPDASRRRAFEVMQNCLFAGAAVRLFGIRVASYNAGVADLNERWDEAAADDFGVERVDLPAGAAPEDQAAVAAEFADGRAAAESQRRRALEEQRQALEDDLETGAAEVASLLVAGVTEDAMVRLFDAGALPADPAVTAAAFPGSGFAARVNPAARWWTLVHSGVIPPALWNMSADEVEDYLWAHPELAEVLVPELALLLGMASLNEQERVLVEALGRYDGRPVGETIDIMVPDRNGLAAVRQGSDRLRQINARLAGGGRLTDGERRYLHAWYDSVGADNLAAMPGYVAEAIAADMLGVPQADEDQYIQRRRDTYLGPVADGIMNLSNPDPEVGGTDRLDRMPAAIQDLVERTEIGVTSPVGDSGEGRRFELTDDDVVVIDGLDRFVGWADLMDASTVPGGRQFTFALGEQAIRAKQDLVAIAAYAVAEPEAFDGVYSYDSDLDEVTAVREAVAEQLDPLLVDGDGAASTMLSTVARNDDAASDLLLDDDLRPAVFVLPWHDDVGAVDVIQAGTRRAPLDDGGLQDEAALAVIEDVARNRLYYTERVDGVARMSDAIAEAVVEVGYHHLDALARPDPIAESDVHEHLTFPGTAERHRGLVLTDDDQEGFLQFVTGVGGTAADDFWLNSTISLQHTIARAMATNDAAQVNNAMAWSGHFQGEYENAAYRYYDLRHDVEAAEQMARVAEGQRNALLLKLVASGGLAGVTFTSVAASNADQSMWSSSPLLSLVTGQMVPMASSVAAGGLNQWVDQQTAPSDDVLRQMEQDLMEAGALADDADSGATQVRDYLLLGAATEAGFSPLDVEGADPRQDYIQALYETTSDGELIRDANGDPRLRDYEAIVNEHPGDVGTYLRTAWANTDHAWRSETERRNETSPTDLPSSLMTAEYYDALRTSNDRRGPQPYPPDDRSWEDEYAGYVWSDESESSLRDVLYGPHNVHARAFNFPAEGDFHVEYPADPFVAAGLRVEVDYSPDFATSAP